MKFPSLKNAVLCRIVFYTIIIGGIIAPLVITTAMSFIPETVKIIIIICMMIGCIAYLIKNFALLIAVDTMLASLQCLNTARKSFVLPRGFSQKTAQKKILRFGKSFECAALLPQPEILQYKSDAPITVYSSGIEKVIAVYHTDFLDKDLYHKIFNSAVTNSRRLKGKKVHRFVDKTQKSEPLNRVTVIFIFANQVDSKLSDTLFKLVCKNGGDGFDRAVIPCVVDLENNICTFDSMRIPYMGFQYPVKNRGIRIIRKCLFENKFTYADSPDTLDAITDFDSEQSLWSFWKTMKKELE